MGVTWKNESVALSTTVYSVIFSSSQQCTVLYACFFLHAVFCLDLDDKSWREEETPGDHIINQFNQPLCIINHRRRIKTEETAKVVAAGWRTEFSQFLATLAVFH